MQKKLLHNRRDSIIYVSLLTSILWMGVTGRATREYIFLEIPDQISQSSFYPFGGYTIYGKKPEAFADLYAFSVDLVERRRTGDLRVVGALIKKHGAPNIGEFRFSSLSLDRSGLAFKTETVSDISYEFSGRFTQAGDFRRFYQSSKHVLRGSLTQYSQGRQSARSEMDFVFVVWKGEPYFERK
jgi:hypothetical protein